MGAAQGTPILPRPGDVWNDENPSMPLVATFSDVLDAADSLDRDSQVELVSVLSKRLAEASREDLIRRVEESRKQLDAGQFEVLTPAQILEQALS